jgi:hypothetical protein
MINVGFFFGFSLAEQNHDHYDEFRIASGSLGTLPLRLWIGIWIISPRARVPCLLTDTAISALRRLVTHKIVSSTVRARQESDEIGD